VLPSQEAIERVDLLINKWFLDASIAFNATTFKYYEPMINAIASIWCWLSRGWRLESDGDLTPHVLSSRITRMEAASGGSRP
jgi:hypothetical protein